MNSRLEELVVRHRKGGLLVDTNILVLYCVGKYKPDLISQFKRTAQFTFRDFKLLQGLWSRFDRVLTTPTILAEVSNMLGPEGMHGYSLLRSIVPMIDSLDEVYDESRVLVTEPYFDKFGLTDTAVACLAHRGALALTNDFRLAGSLTSKGLAAVNFNHLRF